MCDEKCDAKEPKREDDSAVAATRATEISTPEDDENERGWARFFVLIFSDAERFKRFMIFLLLLLAFLLVAGWLWGASAAGVTAVGAGLLRWVSKKFGS
ncbi:hypothetical protein [Umezawaea sp. Da 62-37]|uniref:hypothetical protein n=1 Tax=Umezawaea sp. Da 62-37 TaxID=3075927 RepID=UPI0028F74411|nr:hypothetical protein [Umezawaea sp. Da 62-37]WNV86656.1 hypothetical protein RM788_52515 [Umezawaea sp. Da 62-37]WNV86761.1 hypothetical protein RM788_00290 [Umezawaea sp. Da 62-37]